MHAVQEARAFRKAADTIECLLYQNEKFKRLLEAINQRDDVTDETRRLILDVLSGKKEKLN